MRKFKRINPEQERFVTKLPIYVMKFKNDNGLGTHVFVYNKKNKIAYDAGGTFNPGNIENLAAMRKISEKDLRILGKLHLIPVTAKSVNEVKRGIRQNEEK